MSTLDRIWGFLEGLFFLLCRIYRLIEWGLPPLCREERTGPAPAPDIPVPSSAPSPPTLWELTAGTIKLWRRTSLYHKDKEGEKNTSFYLLIFPAYFKSAVRLYQPEPFYGSFPIHFLLRPLQTNFLPPCYKINFILFVHFPNLQITSSCSLMTYTIGKTDLLYIPHKTLLPVWIFFVLSWWP